MASLLLSPDSPAPEGTSAEDGGGGEDGEDADAETAESRGVAGGVAGGVGPCGVDELLVHTARGGCLMCR